MRLLIARLRPKLEPLLVMQGLEWSDVKPALELIDTAEELQAALEDVEGFLRQLASAAGAAAKRMLVARLRPLFTPVLEKLGLTWDDVVPVLELIDTIEELQAALEDVEEFLRKLAGTAGPAAKRMAIAKLRPMITRVAAKMGLTWEDILPALAKVCQRSPKRRPAARSALTVLDLIVTTHRWTASTSCSRRSTIQRASLPSSPKPPAPPPSASSSPSCATSSNPSRSSRACSGPRPSIGLEVFALAVPLTPMRMAGAFRREDVLPILEAVDSVEELQAAMSNPEAFFEDAASSLGPVAFKLVLAKLRPKIEPVLLRQDVTWEVRRSIQTVITPRVSRRAVATPWLLRLHRRVDSCSLTGHVARLRQAHPAGAQKGSRRA